MLPDDQHFYDAIVAEDNSKLGSDELPPTLK